ncbi:MAG: hypothetical protein ACFFB2_07540 [Promethearchaeota archaeon]
MFVKSTYQEFESVILYETLVIIWIIFTVITQFTSEWVSLVQVVLFSYIVAHFLLKDSHRLIIHPLTIVILLYLVFRVDQMIMNTVVTQILTEITTQTLVFLLKYGETILLLVFFGSFYFFQLDWKSRLRKITRRLPFITLIFLFFLLIIIGNFSQNEVILINPTTMQIEGFTRISIVGSCSGIYGLIIFLSSFFFFINVTRTNRSFKRKLVIFLGIVGVIGIYAVNLLRILILINLSFYFPSDIWSEAHIYLGGIFIISYLVIYWGIIWSLLPIHSSN